LNISDDDTSFVVKDYNISRRHLFNCPQHVLSPLLSNRLEPPWAPCHKVDG
jgi:hypothetical protein